MIKENHHTISVIIPLYNGSKYIEEAIKSVINQSRLPDEIIVIDDGSTDNGPEIVEKLAEDHPIIFFRKENSGQSSARNFAVSKSKCSLIAFIDQDDAWYPNHLEELLKPFNNKNSIPIGWVYSNVDEIDKDGCLVNRELLKLINTEHPKKHLSSCVGTDMFILPCASLISREAYDSVGGFDERLVGYEDDDLFLRIFRNRYENVYIDNSLGVYRIHSSASSQSTKMAASRSIYLNKLLSMIQNDPCKYHLLPNNLVPKFFPYLLGDYYVSITNNSQKESFSRIVADLNSLIPYLPKRKRLIYKSFWPILRNYYLAKLSIFLYKKLKL